jgi:subfamily B ATP-binding cassette protein MsbA
MSPSRHTSSLQLYLRLLGYVKPYWKVFAASIFAMAIVSATEPALPALVKPLLDGTFVDKDRSLLKWLPLVIVGIFVLRGVASFASGYTVHWVAQKVVADLRNAMFARLVRLPTSFYDNNTTGALV